MSAQAILDSGEKLTQGILGHRRSQPRFVSEVVIYAADGCPGCLTDHGQCGCLVAPLKSNLAAAETTSAFRRGVSRGGLVIAAS